MLSARQTQERLYSHLRETISRGQPVLFFFCFVLFEDFCKSLGVFQEVCSTKAEFKNTVDLIYFEVRYSEFPVPQQIRLS